MATPQKAATKLRTTPVEERILQQLQAAREGLDTATIARKLKLHPNGIRLHLQKLEGAGLVERGSAQAAVGRPRDEWRIAPKAVAEATLPYTGWSMARSLASLIKPTAAGLRQVEDAGRAMGAELAADLDAIVGDDPRTTLERALEALGFDPQRHDRSDRTKFVLATCPYAEVVQENPPVVCRLHKGMLQGVLDHVAPNAALTGFEPKPPERAGCIVEIEVKDE